MFLTTLLELSHVSPPTGIPKFDDYFCLVYLTPVRTDCIQLLLQLLNRVLFSLNGVLSNLQHSVELYVRRGEFLFLLAFLLQLFPQILQVLYIYNRVNLPLYSDSPWKEPLHQVT